MQLVTKFKIAAAVVGAGVVALLGRYGYNQTFNYSNGTRSVYNVKFSEKGSLCKTWEGTGTLLTPDDIGGQGHTSTFKFSVSDSQKQAIEALQKATQHPTTLYSLDYTQVKWFISCMHESEYMIKQVTQGEDSAYIFGGAYQGQQQRQPRTQQAPKVPVRR